MEQLGAQAVSSRIVLAYNIVGGGDLKKALFYNYIILYASLMLRHAGLLPSQRLQLLASS